MIEQPILAKISSWFSSLLPAIIGSAISLKLANENSTIIQRFIAFCIGVSLAHYVGGAIIESFHLDPKNLVSQSIFLSTGIFGMASVSEISKQLPEIIKGISDKLLNFIGK